MEDKDSYTSGSYNIKFPLLFLLVIIILGSFFFIPFKRSMFDSFHQSQVQLSSPAPTFYLPGLDGNIVNLTDFRGKVVFLNIWATWCPPCVEEMPSMEMLYQAFKGEQFEMLAVSVDGQGMKAVLPFVQKHRLSFPILMDPDRTISQLYGTTGIPETFIIDQNGILIEKALGARNWSTPEAIGFFRNLIRRQRAG